MDKFGLSNLLSYSLSLARNSIVIHDSYFYLAYSDFILTTDQLWLHPALAAAFVMLSVFLLFHRYVESVRKYILWHYWHGLVADPHGNANGRCCEHHRCQRFIIIFILIQIVYVVVTGSQDSNFVLCSIYKKIHKRWKRREKKMWKKPSGGEERLNIYDFVQENANWFVNLCLIILDSIEARTRICFT